MKTSGYSVLSTADDKVCYHKKRLDTYGYGCSHNCGYCYAKNIYSFSKRAMWHPYSPLVADLNEIQHIVYHSLKPGEIVRLGGMTDCFQEAEKTQRITYKTIKMLNARRVHYLIVTKSTLIATDEYMSILDPEFAHIQISVSMTDDVAAGLYENCASPSERIAAVERLSVAGYDTTLRVSPYAPELIDNDIINRVKCDKLLIGFFFVHPNMMKKFPLVDYSRYTHHEKCYYHLPLEDKISTIEPFIGHFEQISICDDCPTHHQHWRDHFNPKPQDCCNLRLPAPPKTNPLF